MRSLHHSRGAPRPRRGLVTVLVVLAVLSGPVVRVAWTHADADGDGIASCSERLGLRATAADRTWRPDPLDPDTDGDGVLDGEEVRADPPTGLWGRLEEQFSCRSRTYAAVADPARPDTDDDGLDDARELSDGSLAFSLDSDEDGLEDVDEREWGSDPNDGDTDGDGVDDGDDVGEGFTPVVSEERLDRATWLREFGEGATLGDFRDVDSVPQLLGSVSVSAGGAVPVAGWVTSAVADGRDVVANAIRGDWVSAGTSGAALLPYAGDAARAAGLVSKFAGRHPEKVSSLVRALAAWERIPMSVRVRILRAAEPVPVDSLQARGVSEETIVQLARRGTQLSTLVRVLDAVGPRVVQGLPEAHADDHGFVASAEDAGAALRDYARKADRTTEVEGGPVYVDVLPDRLFTGGRLFDSCTRCSPAPSAYESRLRVAKDGSQRYSPTLQAQIDKDSYLRTEGYAVEWHFFAGRSGSALDLRLLQELDRAAIPYFVHLPD